jgi:hypothetical protein
LVVALTWSSSIFAWNSPGHQSVGYIADQLIAGSNTGKQVRKILGTNLKTASVWADCAKGVSRTSSGKFSYSVNPIYKACVPYETVAGQKLMVA